ncbi:sel1 repeat family protein [Solimonas marina]|uniref:Sel1 repeat family protein n=1 Tax=Solimonas marina TaxID=2714601 RepID=A0A969WEV6_9GAMM|nr:sel1 repeat family protein [Solimonas marina]NKF24768.1 sel1 repeat family protein [Solimonas marina]
MALFGNPFFKSESKETEDDYSKGVLCLQKGNFYDADKYFRAAAASGHVSALYNLALINGGASISPCDIDFAISCFRKAGNGGHPKAKEFSTWIDKAEDTSFGTRALAMFAAQLPAQNEPNHLLMMVGCRLYSALCTQYEASDSVVEYELDAASTSDHPYIHRFIDRTGVNKSIYSGGLNRVQQGSAADQITDGLNHLFLGLKHSGHSDDLGLMIRCTIVGYIISKSKHANAASPLLGIDKFFAR